MLEVRADEKRNGGIVLTAECLHNQWPRMGTVAPVVVSPARVAIELFIALDEGLAQGPPAAPVGSGVVKFPRRRDVDLDASIHYVQLVETSENLGGFVDGRGVVREVVLFKRGGCGLEPLHNTNRATTRTTSVAPLRKPTILAGSERALQLAVANRPATGMVVASVFGHSEEGGAVYVDAGSASRVALPNGPLVNRVGKLGAGPATTGAATAHDVRWNG